MAKKSGTKNTAKRGNRALFDEPTQFVGVRLPLSVVAKIDKLVGAHPLLFRDRSDFIRDVVLTATARDQALVREKIKSLDVPQAALTPAENAEEVVREMISKMLASGDSNITRGVIEADQTLRAVDAIAEKHGLTATQITKITAEEINNHLRNKNAGASVAGRQAPAKAPSKTRETLPDVVQVDRQKRGGIKDHKSSR